MSYSVTEGEAGEPRSGGTDTVGRAGTSSSCDTSDPDRVCGGSSRRGGRPVALGVSGLEGPRTPGLIHCRFPLLPRGRVGATPEVRVRVVSGTRPPAWPDRHTGTTLTTGHTGGGPPLVYGPTHTLRRPVIGPRRFERWVRSLTGRGPISGSESRTGLVKDRPVVTLSSRTSARGGGARPVPRPCPQEPDSLDVVAGGSGTTPGRSCSSSVTPGVRPSGPRLTSRGLLSCPVVPSPSLPTPRPDRGPREGSTWGLKDGYSILLWSRSGVQDTPTDTGSLVSVPGSTL